MLVAVPGIFEHGLGWNKGAGVGCMAWRHRVGGRRPLLDLGLHILYCKMLLKKESTQSCSTMQRLKQSCSHPLLYSVTQNAPSVLQQRCPHAKNPTRLSIVRLVLLCVRDAMSAKRIARQKYHSRYKYISFS